MSRQAPYWPQVLSGDGSTKDFAIPFALLDPAHLRVFVGGTLKALGTDYMVLSQSTDKGLYKTWAPSDTRDAILRFVSAPANSANNIKLYRNTPIARPSTPNNPQVGPDTALYAHFRQQERDDAIIKLRDDFGQTALLAPTALTFVAPCDGFIAEMRTMVTKAVTTGGTITAQIDGVTVTGCVATIANSAAVGSIVTAVPSASQASYTKVRKGQAITALPASFAAAGDVEVTFDFQPADLDS